MSTDRSGIHTDSKGFVAVHSLYNALSLDQHNVMLTPFCLPRCDTTIFFMEKINNNYLEVKCVFKMVSSGLDPVQDGKGRIKVQRTVSQEVKLQIVYLRPNTVIVADIT